MDRLATYKRDRWITVQAESFPKGSRVLKAGAGASKYRFRIDHCKYETQDFCRYQGPMVQCTGHIEPITDITVVPLDRWLGAKTICSGYRVVATREA